MFIVYKKKKKKEKNYSMSKTHRDARTGESMYQENGNQNQASLGVKQTSDQKQSKKRKVTMYYYKNNHEDKNNYKYMCTGHCCIQ